MAFIKEDAGLEHTATIENTRVRTSFTPEWPGVRLRLMGTPDLGRILELRKSVRWSADPGAFDLLRGMKEARWAIAEAEKTSVVVGMVGAVPLGEIGILCHLAVEHDYRKMGIGLELSSWAVSYLHSRGAKTVRLDATRQAENLYSSLGFKPVSRRTSYRLEGAAWQTCRRSAQERSPCLLEGGLQVAPLVFEDLPELYGVDLWSSGADRSALIRATLKLRSGWGLAACDASGRIKGYLIRSASGAGIRIGPFMAASTGVAPCSPVRSHARSSPVGALSSRSPSRVPAPPTRCSTSSASSDVPTGFAWSSATLLARKVSKPTAPLRTWLLNLCSSCTGS